MARAAPEPGRPLQSGGHQPEENEMASPAYKLIELVGTSPNSYAEATRNAIEKAGETLHGLSWFEVTELRGAVKDAKVAEFQVTLKVGMKLD
jgi:flavin-binding protein dodecin